MMGAPASRQGQQADRDNQKWQMPHAIGAPKTWDHVAPQAVPEAAKR